MIEVELGNCLAGYTGLVALVQDRIYPVVLPQDVTLPAVTFQLISNPRKTLGQFSSPRFQISCWGSTYKSAKSVAEQVKLAIEQMPNVSTQVFASFNDNEADIYEEKTGTWHIPVDASIWHKN